MSAMTDPTPAMESMEAAIKGRRLQLDRCHYDREMGAFADQVNGMTRLAYVRLDDQGVAAFVNLVLTDVIDGVPSFQAGVAVPERNRRRGYAKALLEAVIKEMAYGYGKTPMKAFTVEAVVSVDNVASNAVCRAVLSETPEAITDHPTGEPALHYVRRVETIRG